MHAGFTEYREAEQALLTRMFEFLKFTLHIVMAIELLIHLNALVAQVVGSLRGTPAHVWLWSGYLLLVLGVILYLALNPDDS